MPTGLDDTVPAPVPFFATLRFATARLNVAVTVAVVLIVTLHVSAVPEHPPPLQPANTALTPGAAVKVTTLPAR